MNNENTGLNLGKNKSNYDILEYGQALKYFDIWYQSSATKWQI